MTFFSDTKLRARVSSSAAGEPDAEWLSGYISVRRWPGRYERGSKQRSTADGWAGGPGLSEAGTGHLNGRMEILHLLRLSSLSSIIWSAMIHVAPGDSASVEEEKKKKRKRKKNDKKKQAILFLT